MTIKAIVRIVKDLDGLGWRQLRSRLLEAEHRHVNVGFPAGQEHKDEDGKHSKYTVAQIAAVHEFGAPAAGIPERPFMRTALQVGRQKFIQLNRQNLLAMVRGGMTAEQALGQLGAMAQGEVQREIAQGTFAPLKTETIKRKGSDRPLIDTGQMRQSVTWEITDD